MSDVLETMREYKEYAETKSEREAFEAVINEITTLRARLAPVDDEALLKMVDEIIYVRSVMIGTSTDEIAREVITHMRPHIEAAERERCAKKILEQNWVDADPEEIAAAIRSGE